MNPIALITGANKGIGFEIARQPGKRGMSIIIGARDPQRWKKTGQPAASSMKRALCHGKRIASRRLCMR